MNEKVFFIIMNIVFYVCFYVWYCDSKAMNEELKMIRSTVQMQGQIFDNRICELEMAVYGPEN